MRKLLGQLVAAVFFLCFALAISLAVGLFMPRARGAVFLALGVFFLFIQWRASVLLDSEARRKQR